MGEFTHSTRLPVDTDTVWQWHAQPGAMARLLPPWQPLRVIQQAEALDDGRSIMQLPGGVRWTAQHRPDWYREGTQFADLLTDDSLGRVLRWKHIHRFAPDGANGCVVTDVVTTTAPGRLVRPALEYRGRQLAAELAALRRSHEWHRGRLTVGVTGSHGMVGRALTALLTTSGVRVVHLVRRPPAGGDERRWDPAAPDPQLLDGLDGLVHLAGEPIAGRFTGDHRARVRDSRVGPTARLAHLAAAAHLPVLVTASAIGYYGADRGDDPVIESSGPGDDFLAEVVRDWEQATAVASDGGVRVVMLRTGIVQSPTGGTLRLLRPLYQAGLGGPIGDGTAWQSWIGLDDLVDLYRRALLDAGLQGPINAVSPNPVRAGEYAATLGRVLHRPARVPVPAVGPAMLLGRQGARELALASQRVIPARLQEIGHTFRRDRLEPELRHGLGRFRLA